MRGRLIGMGKRAKRAPIHCAGVLATACTPGRRRQHGKPYGVVQDNQPDAREGQAGRVRVAERPVVLRKPGNAGRGKGIIWCVVGLLASFVAFATSPILLAIFGLGVLATTAG